MTVTRTLAELIDSTLYNIAGPEDLGARAVLTSALSDTATTLQLSAGASLGTSDLIEIDDELLLVVDTSDPAAPVVSRGYYGTTPDAHTSGTAAHINPAFPRVRIGEAVKRSFARLEALGIPLVKSNVVARTPGMSLVELPERVREVYQVLYHGADGRFLELGSWELFDFLPSAHSASGKALNIGRYVADEDELVIVYRTPYRWSSHPDAPEADATIELPEGVEDLPSLYAAAWLTSSREISRTEIDRAEEWSRTEGYERGTVGAIVRAKWQEFYRALDEARRLNHVPQPLTYKTRPQF